MCSQTLSKNSEFLFSKTEHDSNLPTTRNSFEESLATTKRPFDAALLVTR